jgi:hypothetical protein
MSSNITFVTHLRYDNPDRVDNLQTMIDYYSNILPESKFIFVEDDKEHNVNFDGVKWKKNSTSFYFLKNEGIYHRTKALNYGFKQAKTPIVVSMDTDCIVPKNCILDCEKALLEGTTAAWPYNGYFIDIDYNLKRFFKQTDLNYDVLIHNLENNLELPLCSVYKGYSIRCTSGKHLGVGGVVMFNKDLFLSIGGYNEEFIGWGAEDNEVTERLSKLEHKIYRQTDITSICFHLYHASAQRCDNPYYTHNGEVLAKIIRMNKEELLEHIKTWNNDNI